MFLCLSFLPSPNYLPISNIYLIVSLLLSLSSFRFYSVMALSLLFSYLSVSVSFTLISFLSFSSLLFENAKRRPHHTAEARLANSLSRGKKITWESSEIQKCRWHSSTVYCRSMVKVPCIVEARSKYRVL